MRVVVVTWRHAAVGRGANLELIYTSLLTNFVSFLSMLLFLFFIALAALIGIAGLVLAMQVVGKLVISPRAIVGWNTLLVLVAIAGVVLTVVDYGIEGTEGGWIILTVCGLLALQPANMLLLLQNRQEGGESMMKKKAKKNVVVNPSPVSLPSDNLTTASVTAPILAATSTTSVDNTGDFEGSSEWGEDPPSSASLSGGLFQSSESSEDLELVVATFKNNILSLGSDNYTRVLNDILSRGINRMDAKILQRMSQQLVGSILPLRHANAVVAAIKQNSGTNTGSSMFRVAEFRAWIEGGSK